MQPHGEYKTCDGGPCDDMVKKFTEHALRLAKKPAKFPYEDGKSSHWLSQAYWLSATDREGQPLHFDFVARIEQLEGDLEQLFGPTSVKRSRDSLQTDLRSVYSVGDKNKKDSTAIYVEASSHAH